MVGSDLFDPLPYSWLITLRGVGLMAAAVMVVAAWIVLPQWAGRHGAATGDPAASPEPTAGKADRFATARRTALDALAELAAQHEAGDIDGRSAHQAIQATLRRYAGTRLGVDTTALTNREIEQTKGTPKRVRTVLAVLGEPAFGTAADVAKASVPNSIARTCNLIERW